VIGHSLRKPKTKSLKREKYVIKGEICMTITGKTLRISALLLIVCFISSVMLSGTLAKYTSAYAGQDTALVARWNFDAGDITGTKEEPVKLALFDHLYKKHINDQTTDGTYIIAPGVSDEFTITMDYLADVDADVVITFEKLEGSVDVPVEYSVDNGASWVTLEELAEKFAQKIIDMDTADGLTEAVPAVDGTFRIPASGVDATEATNITQTVKWRWAYDAESQVGQGVVGIASDDSRDTKLGEDSSAAGTNRISYGIKVTITATQVAPTTE
jgi:hypothetical protein